MESTGPKEPWGREVSWLSPPGPWCAEVSCICASMGRGVRVRVWVRVWVRVRLSSPYLREEGRQLKVRVRVGSP